MWRQTAFVPFFDRYLKDHIYYVDNNKSNARSYVALFQQSSGMAAELGAAFRFVVIHVHLPGFIWYLLGLDSLLLLLTVIKRKRYETFALTSPVYTLFL